MKRKIIAIIAVMMISLSWFSKAPTQQPKAVVGAITIGSALFTLVAMMMMNGDVIVDGTQELYDFAEEVVTRCGDNIEWLTTEEGQAWLDEYLSDPTVYEQYMNIYDLSREMIAPEALESGKIEISYQDYLAICQALKVEIGLKNTVRTNFTGVKMNLETPYMPYNYMRALDDGEVLYTIPYLIHDDVVYTCQYYLGYKAKILYPSQEYERGCYFILGAVIPYNEAYMINGLYGAQHGGTIDIRFSYDKKIYGSCIAETYISGGNFVSRSIDNNTGEEYVFKNDTAVFMTLDGTETIEYSNQLEQGYIISDVYPTYLEAETSTDYVHVEDLSDELETILPITDNPTLIIDPAADDVKGETIVTNITGIEDITLNEITNTQIKTDIDIPSVIIDKFPFCIPFDFVKLITIFIEEPIDPVFVIPISNIDDTVYNNFDNETLNKAMGEGSGEKMFEIDEEIVIDLSGIPIIQVICYVVIDVGFIALLIFITTKMIHH